MNERVELSLSLTRTTTKAKDEEVLNEFTLNFTGNDIPNIGDAFGVVVPDEHYWKNLNIDVAENYYKMKFDGMDEKVVTLKGIKISKKISKDGDQIFNTNITFSKDVDSWDQIFTNSYLKRKEDVLNDKGKMKRTTVLYEVSFQKM
jgi:hypothetical protein